MVLSSNPKMLSSVWPIDFQYHREAATTTYICVGYVKIVADFTVEQQFKHLNKKAVLPQGNRAMPQVFFSVEVRQQHSLQV